MGKRAPGFALRYAFISWRRYHLCKRKILKKHKPWISYEDFAYERLKEIAPNFCPLFAKNQKCHEISELNCYHCACPHYRITQKGALLSYCRVASKDARYIKSREFRLLDCTACTLPHLCYNT